MPRVPIDPDAFRIPAAEDESPRLLGSYSPSAQRYFWPRQKRCPITLDPVEDCELSPRGTLYSWTFVEMPWMGSMKVDPGGGYGVGQVDLAEGVRVQALIDGEMGDWQIDMPMVLRARVVGRDEDGNDRCTIAFAPDGSAS